MRRLALRGEHLRKDLGAAGNSDSDRERVRIWRVGLLDRSIEVEPFIGALNNLCRICSVWRRPGKDIVGPGYSRIEILGGTC